MKAVTGLGEYHDMSVAVLEDLIVDFMDELCIFILLMKRSRSCCRPIISGRYWSNGLRIQILRRCQTTFPTVSVAIRCIGQEKSPTQTRNFGDPFSRATVHRFRGYWIVFGGGLRAENPNLKPLGVNSVQNVPFGGGKEFSEFVYETGIMCLPRPNRARQRDDPWVGPGEGGGYAGCVGEAPEAV